MSKSESNQDMTDTNSKREKRAFSSSTNVYHTCACKTVRRRADSFAALNEVTENQIELTEMRECDNCQRNNPSKTTETTPEPKSESLQRLTVRLPSEHIDDLEAMVEQEEINNRCQGIRIALKEYLMNS